MNKWRVMSARSFSTRSRVFVAQWEIQSCVRLSATAWPVVSVVPHLKKLRGIKVGIRYIEVLSSSGMKGRK